MAEDMAVEEDGSMEDGGMENEASEETEAEEGPYILNFEASTIEGEVLTSECFSGPGSPC